MTAVGGTIERRLRVERLPVWRRCEASRLVLRELYWLNLALTSLSIPAISWGCSKLSIRFKKVWRDSVPFGETR